MKETGLQINLFGEAVHILNTKEIYRTVKCGRCGNTVKSSQSKTHLSYGNTLTICKECLSKDSKFHKGKQRRNDIRFHKESMA
jgi:hypothetical protein